MRCPVYAQGQRMLFDDADDGAGLRAPRGTARLSPAAGRASWWMRGSPAGNCSSACRWPTKIPAALDALLITHEHQDHVQGVAVLARKLGVPVYFTQATHRAWMRWMMPHKRMTYAAWLALRQSRPGPTARQSEAASTARFR